MIFCDVRIETINAPATAKEVRIAQFLTLATSNILARRRRFTTCETNAVALAISLFVYQCDVLAIRASVETLWLVVFRIKVGSSVVV
jgi:hypothetical protein